MPIRTALLAAATMTLLTLPLTHPAAAEWRRYVEPNGASITVPRHLFDAPVRRDDTGTAFSDRSGEVQMTVFGWNNDAGHTLRTIADDLRAEMAREREVTYERIGRTFMVQSGLMRDEDAIFYERTEPSRDGSRFVTMRLVYPPSRRGDVDRHIKRMGLSLKRPR